VVRLAIAMDPRIMPKTTSMVTIMM
jgi:hypothetical protein